MTPPQVTLIKAEIPSCFTCKFLRRWNYPETQEEPGDTGWECGHPNGETFSPGSMEDLHPDPNCRDCRGTGFVDQDYGTSINVGAVYGAGGIVNNAVECGCDEESQEEEDERLAEHYAEECFGYERFDWSAQGEPDEFGELTPEQIQELAEVEAEAQKETYLRRGWIDSEGKLTPLYFEKAQLDYDRRAGK